MKSNSSLLCTAISLGLCAISPALQSQSRFDVLTQHNDNARSGAYLAETTLTPALVSSGRFGLLYARDVSGDVLAQPLYVHQVRTARGRTNMFFIATALNNVYAFDADDLNPAPQAGRVWSRTLCGSFEVGICDETKSHRVGVTSTPVIDAATQTMYVVARCSQVAGGPAAGGQANSDNYLYAINIADGTDRHSPKKIEAIDPADGHTAFDPRCHRNRPGLLLMNGTIFMAFGTFSCDGGCPLAPYHGWAMAYRASDLQQVGVFNTSTGASAAGVWQSGNGLVGADDGSVYFATGNDESPTAALGDSFVKLRLTASGLQLAGSFTPNNAAILRAGDTDLGSGGPMLLPGGKLIGGGKEGKFYVLDANTMRLTQNCDAAAGHCGPGVSISTTGDGFQAFLNTYHNNPARPACAPAGGAAGCNQGSPVADCYIAPSRYELGELCGPNIHGGPIYWKPRAVSYGLIYDLPEKDFLKAFRYDQSPARVTEAPVLTGTGTWARQPDDGMSGGASSISANGDVDGILWSSLGTRNAQWENAPGRLAAFDALTLRQIWVDDDTLNFAKFNAPTIAAGKVIRASFSDRVLVYGARLQGFPIWRYTAVPCVGESCPGWQRLDINSKTIATAAAGRHLYQLHNDGWIWRYTGVQCSGESCPGWQRLDRNSKTVAIAAAGGQLYQLHNDGWIWRYTGSPCSGESCPGWQRLDRNSKTIAIAGAGDQLYQLHNDGWIWRYTGVACSGESCPGWQRLDHNSKTIAIAGAGGQLYQLHNDGWIWRYTGVACSGESCPGWQRLDNNFRTGGISAGDQLYQLHSKGQLFQRHNDGWIWRYTGLPCTGDACPGWERLDNNPNTAQIVAAGNQLFQLHKNGWIWRYTGKPCAGEACSGWQRLDNNANTAAIVAGGNQLFQLHKNGWIWRYSGTPCTGDSCPGWQRLDNNANTIAIVAAATGLYQLHKTGLIWTYTGTPCSGESCPGWQRLDNNPKTRAITASSGQN